MEVFQFFHSFSPAQTFTAFIIYKERFHQQFIKGTQLIFGCFIVPGSATGNIGNTFYIFDQIRFTADIIRQFGVRHSDAFQSVGIPQIRVYDTFWPVFWPFRSLLLIRRH